MMMASLGNQSYVTVELQINRSCLKHIVNSINFNSFNIKSIKIYFQSIKQFLKRASNKHSCNSITLLPTVNNMTVSTAKPSREGYGIATTIHKEGSE